MLWARPRSVGVLLSVMAIFASCERNLCDMTPDGSVWLTVARLSWAEDKFHREHGRYGELQEMTNLLDGLPPSATSGRIGSYAVTLELANGGYVLRADPKFPHGNRRLAAFYADQSGAVTYNSSGTQAGPYDNSMRY